MRRGTRLWLSRSIKEEVYAGYPGSGEILANRGRSCGLGGHTPLKLEKTTVSERSPNPAARQGRISRLPVFSEHCLTQRNYIIEGQPGSCGGPLLFNGFEKIRDVAMRNAEERRDLL